MKIEIKETDQFRIDLAVDIIGKNIQELSSKTILWTGTNGFLGQWVLRVIEFINQKILETPCTLYAFDESLPDKSLIERFSASNIHFRSHNLKTKLWPMAEKMDYVVHMAGIASPFHYKLRPLDTIDVTLEGIRSALEIARNSGAKFLFTSSSEVYQTPSIIPTPENYIGAIPSNNERSCYDVSKLMGENLAYVYFKQYGLETVVVRIFNSFGPGLSESDYRILPRIASSVLNNQPLDIFLNSVQPTRTYCPAGNTIAGIFLALLNGKGGEIYNIGQDGPEITVLELITKIEILRNIKIPYNIVPPTSVYEQEPLRRCPDISKARKHLGYRPDISLEIGLNSFFDWAMTNYKK